MSVWIETKNELPSKSGLYITYSTNKDRDYEGCALEEQICFFFKENVGTGKSLWQSHLGFYDNGITHWLKIINPELK